MSRRAGLVLAVLLGLADLGLPLAGGDFPPLAVALAAAALGLVTLVAVWLGRRGSRAALGTVVATRVLSALTAVPALTEPAVPAATKLAAGAIIALTVACVALLTPALRRRSEVPARA
jgi:hypothetical protein